LNHLVLEHLSGVKGGCPLEEAYYPLKALKRIFYAIFIWFLTHDGEIREQERTNKEGRSLGFRREASSLSPSIYLCCLEENSVVTKSLGVEFVHECLGKVR
jgi:hypothetical protein